MNRFNLFLGIVCAGLVVLITGLVLGGDHTVPALTSTSIQRTPVAVRTAQISFLFNRPMDRASVASGFTMSPSVPGTFSWSGQRVVYTFSAPLAYDRQYTVAIHNARDADGKAMAPAELHFATTPRTLAYIGTEKDELRRVVLLQVQNGIRTILTPTDLQVTAIYPHPDGLHILFMAGHGDTIAKLTDSQELYSINRDGSDLRKLADSTQYRNGTLSMSPDGSLLALERWPMDAARLAPGKQALWISGFPQTDWQPFWRQDASGPAFFTPDGASLLAWTLRDGFFLAPLVQNTGPTEILGTFMSAFGFSSTAARAVFTEYEADDLLHNLNHIVVVESGGKRTLIAQNKGTIAEPVLTHAGDAVLYLLLRREDNTKPLPPFHLYASSLATDSSTQLTNDPAFSEESFSLSPDDQYVAFERYGALDPQNIGADYRADHEQTTGIFADASLWLLDLHEQGAPVYLSTHGRSPVWLP